MRQRRGGLGEGKRGGPTGPLSVTSASDAGSGTGGDGQSSLFDRQDAMDGQAQLDRSNQPPAPAEVDDRAGHRDRLRQRFRVGGADALPDYELIEMILFRAFPRGDTKPLAKRLLAHLGTFAEVINAPEERLREIDGVGDRVIGELKLVRAAALRLMRGEIIGRQVLGSWAAVLAYCQAAQGYDTREQFRILFLDKRNQLIADEVQQRGTVDHTPVYVREVVKRALELSASAIILVHNHPSGDPSPSRTDIDMTRQVIDAARPLGIAVHDHIIVGRSGHASLKALKVI